LDRKQYAELFQLNEMELALLTGLIPRQQLLLERADLANVLSLTVDPKSYWIYTNTPIDNERVAPSSVSGASKRVWTASRPPPEPRRCSMSGRILSVLVAMGVGLSAGRPAIGQSRAFARCLRRSGA